MTPGAEPAPEEDPADPNSRLFGTLPLILLTGVLLLGAYYIHLVHPRLGPENFPLWGLLLTLGIVAAIGAVVSWFFATDEEETVPAPDDSPAPAAPRTPRASRREFGRPAPELSAPATATGPAGGVGRTVVAGGSSSADPWNEDVLPPVTPHGPRPVLTTPDDPGDIGRALEELAEIQRQLTARPSPTPTGREVPARA